MAKKRAQKPAAAESAKQPAAASAVPQAGGSAAAATATGINARACAPCECVPVIDHLQVYMAVAELRSLVLELSAEEAAVGSITPITGPEFTLQHGGMIIEETIVPKVCQLLYDDEEGGDDGADGGAKQPEPEVDVSGASTEVVTLTVEQVEFIEEEQKKERLFDLFDAYDVDGSGEICLEELRMVLNEKGYDDRFVEHYFFHLDINKDGNITRDEFYTAMKFIPSTILHDNNKSSEDEMLDVFDRLDKDGSGEIDLNELSEWLLKEGMPQEFIDEYFMALDLDGDGKVSRDEYRQCFGLLTGVGM